jgi:hypothetical protein
VSTESSLEYTPRIRRETTSPKPAKSPCYLAKSPNRVFWSVTLLPCTLAKRWAAHGKRLIHLSPLRMRGPWCFSRRRSRTTLRSTTASGKKTLRMHTRRLPAFLTVRMAVLSMVLGVAAFLELVCGPAQAQPLPSWAEGPAIELQQNWLTESPACRKKTRMRSGRRLIRANPRSTWTRRSWGVIGTAFRRCCLILP